MNLVRSWQAGVLRASGALLLVPLGLAATVAIAASLGGVHGIGRLGQLVAGPGVPIAGASNPPRSIAQATGGVAPVVEQLPVVPLRVPEPAATSPAAQRRERQTERKRRRHGSPQRSPGPGTTTQPPPASAPQPAPPAQKPPGPLHRATQPIQDAVRRLPPPVGQIGGDAVQTVVDLVEPPQVRLTGGR